MASTREDSDRRGRRGFLRGAIALGGSAMLGSGCERRETPREHPPAAPAPAPVLAAPTPPPAAVSPFPDGQNAEYFVLHGATPLTAETRREAIGTSVITASDRLFLRQNLPLPSPSILADRDAWSVRVDGVMQPGTIRLGELKRLRVETVAMVLQCSGNGRKYFEHHPSGSPWTVGASGCVMWSGVPIRELVRRFGGLEPGARFVTATGADPLPSNLPAQDAVVERSIPIAKGLEDCLLAWEMNGEPIPLGHGGPLRLIVPGYYGVNQVKFVKRVAFTAAESDAKIQQTGYRLRPIGAPGSPTQPTMWAMPVKSFITSPTPHAPAVGGTVVVTGVAFGGTEPLRKVEVSTDGTTWRPATFVGPDLGKYAWRVFTFELESAPGTLTLYSRATTTSGATQPEHRVENDHGYGNNSWRDMGLTVRVCAPEDAVCLEGERETIEGPHAPRHLAPLSERAERGRAIFAELANPSCKTCHTLESAQATGTVGPNLDTLQPTLEQVRRAVTNGVGTMPAFGRTLTAEQIEDLAAYVFEVTR